MSLVEFGFVVRVIGWFVFVFSFWVLLFVWGYVLSGVFCSLIGYVCC